MSTTETPTVVECETSQCSNAATCRGRYESNHDPLRAACDSCCGHGNEDGWCEPIERESVADLDVATDKLMDFMCSQLDASLYKRLATMTKGGQS